MAHIVAVLMFVLTLPAVALAETFTYSISVFDTGEPSSFSFLFQIPISPAIGEPNVVSSTLSGTLTDGGTDGVTLTPTLADLDGDGVAELAVGGVSTGGGALVNMGVDIGHSSSSAGAYGPFAEGPQSGPGPGPWDLLTINVAFTLSGGGDALGLSGSFTIEPGEVPVPEPSALWLISVGVAAAAMVRRRAV